MTTTEVFTYCFWVLFILFAFVVFKVVIHLKDWYCPKCEHNWKGKKGDCPSCGHPDIKEYHVRIKEEHCQCNS